MYDDSIKALITLDVKNARLKMGLPKLELASFGGPISRRDDLL